MALDYRHFLGATLPSGLCDHSEMLHRLPLSEMISLVRAGSISSLELVDAHLDQIERVNPHLNAFTMVLADQARQSARRADQGLKTGVLHGIPVTVKDSFDVSGLP